MKAQQVAIDRLAQFEQLGSNLARYWSIPVSVIVELGEWALVRRGDGLSFVVETKDIERSGGIEHESYQHEISWPN